MSNDPILSALEDMAREIAESHEANRFNPDKDIPFTQYLQPDGRMMQVWAKNRPEGVVFEAKELMAQGIHFDAEMLSDGSTISFTAEREVDGETEVLSAVIVRNGPDVPAAVDRLICEATEFLAKNA